MSPPVASPTRQDEHGRMEAQMTDSTTDESRQTPAARTRVLARLLARLRGTAPVVPDSGPEPWRRTLVPVGVVAAWWLLSLGCYLAGWPIAYTRVNAGWAALLVVASTVALLVGFLFVARRLPAEVRVASQRTPVILVIGAIGGLVLLVPWAETYSGYHLWEVGQALLDQGGAFLAASERIGSGTTSRLPIVAAQVVLAPATMAVIPAAALAWFERRQQGLLLLAGLVTNTTMSVLVGRDFYLALALVLVACAWFVSRVRRRLGPTPWVFLTVGGGLAAFFIAFGARKLARQYSFPLCPPGTVGNACTVPHAPNLWESLTVSFASYLSQGMEGLGRAFEGTWAFGGGYRHSAAVTGILESVFGPSPTRVVTDQLESADWSATAYWSTGFAWIANDVPWVLVPVVVGLLAAFLALAWRRVVRDGDWLSMSVFGYSWFTAFFLAQNLQLATSGPLYVGHAVLCVLFLGREVRDVLRRRQTVERIPRRASSNADVAK
jgi:hypothetical protein